MRPLRRRGRGVGHVQSFSISVAAHALCLFLLITLPTCGRRGKTEHKVYTFDLVDPSLLTMKKPKSRTAPKKKKVEKVKKKPKPKPKKKKKVIRKKAALPKTKKSIEEKIKEKMKEVDKKDWLEPSKLEELSKAKLLDTGAFTNAWYNDVVASKIYQHWKTPSKSLSEEDDLKVIVRFRIRRDGTVSVVGVDRQSGSEMLDSSALQAVKEAQPLPPLPDDYRGDFLEVCMTFIPEE